MRDENQKSSSGFGAVADGITAGRVFAVAYPFVLEDVDVPPGDPEALELVTIKIWRPGVEWEQEDEGSAAACADAFGEMLLTVVDVHKPGRFPTRVFYMRQWKDPTGKVFGKGGLRIATLEKFKRLCRGYRHDIWVDGELRAKP